MKPRMTVIAAALMAAPFALLSTMASAQELKRPNYNLIELDYVYGAMDINSPSLPEQQNADSFYLPSGLELQGSWAVADQVLLRASYYSGMGEWKKTSDVDVTSGVVAIGWLAPTTDATGIDVSLEYRGDEIKIKNSPTYKEDVEGLGISFGVRATPWQNTEFGVRVGWYEGDFNGSIAYEINAAYNFSEKWGINAYWDSMDADVNSSTLQSYELNKFGIGGRFYF